MPHVDPVILLVNNEDNKYASQHNETWKTWLVYTD